MSVPDWVFDKLSPEREKIFRQWARDNYIPHSVISEAWHPVVRDECQKMNDDNDPTQCQPGSEYLKNFIEN